MEKKPYFCIMLQTEQALASTNHHLERNWAKTESQTWACTHFA